MAINNWNKPRSQKDESTIDNSAKKNGYKITIDRPAKQPLDFKEHSERLSEIIVKSTPQFTVGIFGGWGTGKTTMMQMIKDEIDNNHFEFTTTIWFDSWRYENEEYSALVPLIRTIIIGIQNSIIKSTKSEKIKALNRIKRHLYKIGEVVLNNIELNIGAGISIDKENKAEGGVKFDLQKMIDDYRSDGYFYHGQNKVPLYEHISDRLKKELKKIRYNDIGELIYDFRLIIFIDDLDRCTPEKALELLESIKTFFDIEGIIYVIGMDPSTIDPIIQVKYGENSRISGLDYLQKIVQLPFQIPVWSENDLGNTITEMAKETGLSKDITDKLLDDKIKNLILKSAKLNPRNIKRFINSLVLSYNTSDKKIQNIDFENLRNYIIESYLESMISVQTFYFRGEKWLKFLKMINNYDERVQFLTHFIMVVVNENISYQELQNKIKDFQLHKYYKLSEKTLQLYNELIKTNDEEFFDFLVNAAIPLLRIDRIENYLRIVDTRRNIDTTENTKIKSYECLNELKNGIKSFNEHIQRFIIHLPFLELDKIVHKLEIDLSYADLSGANLSQANLSGFNLSEAKLSGAIMSKADLSEAKLSGAILSKADLSEAKLSGANLLGAILPAANLPAANLSEVNLSYADLSGANLSQANLSKARFSRADLSFANLSGANLSQANLSGANLSQANLSGAILSKANLSYASSLGANMSDTDLSGAILSEANLSGVILLRAILDQANLSQADFSNSIIIEPQKYELTHLYQKTNFKDAISDIMEFIYHTSKFTESIPNFVNNKKELKKILEQMQLSKQDLEYILEASNLPEK